MSLLNLIVKEVSRKECEKFILEIHYAKRFPSISHAYGLFENDILIGIVTYGSPFSSHLRKGIAGEEFKNSVLELNRLCLLHNRKNEASFLVSRSMKLLPKDNIIVSYSDCSQGHCGYVYQACNFLYTGITKSRNEWAIKGYDHLHSLTISDKFKGHKNRLQAIKDHYKDDFYYKARPQKHRYIMIIGSKKFKKSVINSLKYSLEKYPKIKGALYE